ncbi:MAG: OmpA family protein [Myxococcales bacterium]|nr:OmpA family protein [Myxococcales bacterium]
MNWVNRAFIVSALAGILGAGTSASAEPNQGFELNRYQPTAAGEWSFAVDHPWYSSTRRFAAGITLNYGHSPLVAGSQDANGAFSESQSLINHLFIAHVDLAGSFLDRVLITASLPVVLTSAGDPAFASGAAVGDLRLGGKVRLYGQPYASVFSASVGLDLWVPFRAMTDSLPPTASDQSVRALPKLVVGGVWKKLLWSSTLGFLIRPEAVTVSPPNFAGSQGRAASELQIGLSAAYFDQERRFAVGPEMILTAAAAGEDSFSRFGTSLELLLAGHYNIAKMIQTGLAVGAGFVRQPGTPDFRMLFRLAYAPVAEKKRENDRDGDGILDAEDACPDTKGIRTSNPATHGCPPPTDRDRDGVADVNDYCPDVHQGQTPDPARLGCPMSAPEADRDGDGVLDKDDLCPDLPRGPVPDPARFGCPAPDTDRDGIQDPVDLCPMEPVGMSPDPARRGCPLPDRDHDTVPDKTDFCPDKPGAPHPDPKKNGCPGLLTVDHGKIVILKPVYFATDKDIILPQSFPVLQAVADALKAATGIRQVRIEGHTDSQGVRIYNVDLSQRRARSVVTWLVQHGIEVERLQSEGYGPDRPIDTNATVAGRAKNRRVEFIILDGNAAIPSNPAQ